jgi:hypothetical protein
MESETFHLKDRVTHDGATFDECRFCIRISIQKTNVFSVNTRSEA